MPSAALEQWRSSAAGAFDEIEHAHRAVGGARPGRRFLTQQLNYAYATLLAARFQGFARALHTQAADVIAAGAGGSAHQVLLLEGFTRNRALDRRNAQPNAIAEDFDRFGMEIWERAKAHRSDNDRRRQRLGELIAWRNAIAHDDVAAKIARGALVPDRVKLTTCTRWRSALNVLAVSLDHVVADQCEALGLTRPW